MALEQYVIFPLLIEIQAQGTFSCILIWTCWLILVWVSERLSEATLGSWRINTSEGPLLLGLSSGCCAGIRAQCCHIFWFFERSSEIWLFMWKLLRLTPWKLMCSFYKQRVSQVKHIWALAFVSQVFGVCSWLPLAGKRNSRSLGQVLTWWQGEVVDRKTCVELWWFSALARGNLWICDHCRYQPKDASVILKCSLISVRSLIVSTELNVLWGRWLEGTPFQGLLSSELTWGSIVMMHSFAQGGCWAVASGKPLYLTASLGVVIWSRARLVCGDDFGPFINVMRVCKPRRQRLDACVYTFSIVTAHRYPFWAQELALYPTLLRKSSLEFWRILKISCPDNISFVWDW